ncbi:hypothetical protein EW15_1132 [Prochlorococcus sp. MIT 0801]|nr:hypothetical protein EW15_1132 [Prochlorococcus sp. MIT 0801]
MNNKKYGTVQNFFGWSLSKHCLHIIKPFLRHNVSADIFLHN